MKKLIYPALIAIAGMTFAGCSSAIDAKNFSVNSIQDDSNFTSKTASKKYPFKTDVRCVSNTTFADVEYVQGSSPEVIVTGPESELEYFRVVTEGKSLMITCTKNYKNGSPKIKIKVTSPAIDEFRLMGAGNLKAKSIQSDSKFQMRLTGAGKAEIASIQAPAVELLLSGAGDIEVATIEGSSTLITATGAGDIEVANLTSSVATVRLSGAGEIEIDRLTAPSTEIMLSGAGDIEVKKIEGSTLSVNSPGAGNIKISGEVSNMSLISTGVGDINATGMKAATTSKIQRGVGTIKD